MGSRNWLLTGVISLLAAASFPALAGGWSTYNTAFPGFPCSDGWAACLSGDQAVGPGMSRDGAGRPIPADARVGWFDLKPTAVFSPFAGLSAYSGAVGGEVAAVVAPPTPAPTFDGPDEPAPAPAPTAAVSPTPTSAPTSSPTSWTSPAPAPAPVATAPRATPTSAPVATTPTAAPTPVATAPTPVAVAPESTAMKSVAPPTAPSAADDSCDDLVKIEPQAMLGQLRTGQVKCVEARIGTEGAQTAKDKLSRVLIANAEGKGDKVEWERLVKRHLEDIDRSDPDMCFKYATQLSRGGTGRASSVIRWADYALENKQRWSGTTYTKRVYTLYRLKTEAANKIWTEAEEVFATKEHTDENEAKAAKWRGQTKDFAREWLDYAKASDQDTKSALAICVSAAGNRAFCEG
jgi:hypothetical protein